MSFPGHHNGVKASFGEPKGMESQHEVSYPPKAMGEKHTMAGHANIECEGHHSSHHEGMKRGGRKHHSY